MPKNKIIIMCCGISILGFSFTIYANQNNYRDPTQPLGKAFQSQDTQQENSNPYGLTIDSILISKNATNNRKIVSINGRLLQIGDKLDDVTIIDIYPHGVRLKDSTGEFTISMSYYKVKNSVDNVNIMEGSHENNKAVK